MSRIVLVGDTGETNTRFGLTDPLTGQVDHVRQFRNAQYETYEQAAADYLASVGRERVAASVLAFAAPITDDCVSLTNHSWSVTKSAVSACTGSARVEFLNDLEALAWSLDRLADIGIEDIGAPDARDARPGGRMVVGIGLVEVYAWACGHTGQPEQTLPGIEITARGIDGSDPAAALACDMLVRFAARVAGDLALAFLPFGGIYFAGSVTQALVPLLHQPRFRHLFDQKGRQTALMQKFPLHILTDGTAALFGCSAFASTLEFPTGDPS